MAMEPALRTSEPLDASIPFRINAGAERRQRWTSAAPSLASFSRKSPRAIAADEISTGDHGSAIFTWLSVSFHICGAVRA